MFEDGVLSPDSGVVAHKHHAIHALIHAFDHRKRRRASAVQAGARIQFFDQDVSAGVMPIGDNHFVCAAIECASDGSVDIFRHQSAETSVFGMVRVDVIPVYYPGDPLHVRSYQDFHIILPFGLIGILDG